MLTFHHLEKKIDGKLEKLLTHPTFLKTVGTLLNLNSHRKIFVNRSLTAGWKLLQLPNKRDQERTLFLINELHHKFAELEAKLEATRAVDMPSGRRIANVSKIAKIAKKKYANDAYQVEIQ